MFLTLDTHTRGHPQAGGQEYRIIVLQQQFKSNVLTDLRVVVHIHAQRDDVLDVLVKVGIRQTVAGHAVAQHAAGR